MRNTGMPIIGLQRVGRAAKLLLILAIVPALFSTSAPAATVTDCLGRSVTVPDRVERIACLYAFAGHVVAMLGRGDDIVAVSNGLKRDVLLNRMCPSIGNAIVPKTQGAINIEELLQARVDVVFVPGEVGRNEAEAKKFDLFNLPYLVVDYHSIAGQQKTIQMIGTAINAAEQARQFNDYYNKCIERVDSVAGAIPREKRTRLYLSTVEANRTPGRNTLSTDWIEKTGIVNVALEQPRSFLEGTNHVGIEQILLWNPEVILVNEPGVKAKILKSGQWAALKAVKSGKVYQMPIGISRWGHPGSLETPLAMLWTAKTVYPDLFPDIDVETETKAFYSTFYKHDLTDQMLNRILTGKGMREPKNKRKNRKPKKNRT